MTFVTKNERETEKLGEALGRLVKRGDVLALYGEMGAGRTAFVRGLARGLSVLAPVASPTFAIANEYPGDTPLFHFDAYRLSSGDELIEIGWDDYLDRGGVCAVEWSENVDGIFDDGALRVRIEKTGESTRAITIEGVCGIEDIGG